VLDYIEREWTLVFHIKLTNYVVKRAYGNFIIAANPDNHTVKLYELTPDTSGQIATDLVLRKSNRALKFDVCDLE